MESTDCIWVMWKDPISRTRHLIGELVRDKGYKFRYNLKKISEAEESGFKPLVAFPDITETYSSDELFPVFTCRLPDRRRSDIKEVLKKYGMESYDAYELLSRTEGKLPTDNLEFIRPIYLNENNIKRYFFIAGTRHHDICNKSDCLKKVKFDIGEKLILELEPENKFDKYAVKILNNESKILGHVPRYYSEAVSKALYNKRDITCEVVSINDKKNCQECIRVKLIIK